MHLAPSGWVFEPDESKPGKEIVRQIGVYPIGVDPVSRFVYCEILLKTSSYYLKPMCINYRHGMAPKIFYCSPILIK